MEEQRERESTSTGGGGGGGREDGDVKEGADDKQQLFLTAIHDEDRLESKNNMEGSSLNEDLALSNDVVGSDDDKQSYDLNLIFTALSLLF